MPRDVRTGKNFWPTHGFSPVKKAFRGGAELSPPRESGEAVFFSASASDGHGLRVPGRLGGRGF